MTLTSRKTQQEVRMQLDKLDLELLRRVIREELEAHERRKGCGHGCKRGNCGRHDCSWPQMGRAYG